MQITLTVNGQTHSLEVAPNRLLVDVLREELGLTGTHLGCDTSQCGACMVLLNGDAVKSCALLAVQLDGAAVTTIEGLSDGETLGPVQEAFREAHGLQCGFCTPGMVIAITDLLSKTPQPSESEIRHWLEGNICRCTGYQNIVKAAQLAADKQAASA
jgi:carbon-monoxide dehydrogenase small subunit